MLNGYLVRYKKTLIIAGVLIASLGIGWAIYYNVFLFHVTSISPDPKAASYLSPRLIVNFNKEISTDNLKVTAQDISVTASVDKKRVVIMLPEVLEADKTYKITLSSVDSKSGDQLRDYVIDFATVLNRESLTDEDYKIILDRQEAGKSEIINDPIFKYLPYSTLDYEMEGVIKNADTEFEKITIQIELQLSAADVRIDRNAAIERYKAEAMSYLDSLADIQLENYNVEVTVIEPTL